MTTPATDTDPTSVAARFGGLAISGWAAVPLAMLRTRSALGISQGQLSTIIAIISFYNRSNRWPSVSQTVLAKQAGIPRPSVNDALMNLRDRGLLAIRLDPKHRPSGRPSSPLRYCLQPYLVAVLALDARRHASRRLLISEARERLSHFSAEVRAGIWSWRIGSMTSETLDRLIERYELLYLSEILTEIEAN